MSDPSQEPDLVKVTEIFLIPSSFLVAALGTADTNLHRAGVSVVGLLVSVLWCACSREAFAEMLSSDALGSGPIRRNRTRILYLLPIVFAVGWFLSLLGHAILWNRPLGADLIN